MKYATILLLFILVGCSGNGLQYVKCHSDHKTGVVTYGPFSDYTVCFRKDEVR